ncbi:nardilysin-like [Homarus americanus]|uniref:nardilysin-like n=1 Tax=Homarus americanus TaxID=6706 RepID=UPI001C48FAF2|nr:nardilysin-like [Homarus americanus]
MSSKRVLSLISGRAVKKPRKVRPQGRRMMRGYTTETGGGGDDGGHIPPPPQVSHNASVLPAVQVLDTPTKSPFDKKEYRVIRLDCGIRVLLISDAGRFIAGAEEEDDSEEEEIDQNEEDEVDQSEDDDDDDAEIEDEEEEEGDIKGGKSGADSTKYLAAASLTVGVGSFEDPPEIPGLMHFLEHMVFMGSEKYPKENAFDYYIKKHGGHDNAHTDMEHTTFYFEVQECYLHESLDRFAQFFINPLMKQEAMTREREAVHSEFQMALPEDAYRSQQLFGSFAAEGHPMGKFTWGNESTLNIGIPDEELHKKLHELRLKYYSSHYMTLAVQARFSLDCLQEYVCNIFSQVPGNNIPRPTYNHLEFPFPVEKLHRLYRVVPTKEYHCVEINWALPSLLKYYHTKPLHYVSHLIGHEGRGSILSCLKKKVWAVGLYSGNDESGFEHNSTYAVMSISVELTDEGFKNIDKVLCIVFQYMAMIQRAGPVERIFREIQQMEQLNFDYAEEPTTIENVENLSEAMQIFPPVDYLTGDTLMGDYNPQIIKECLDALVPEKCNILISSKTFDEQNICHLTEKWFGTKYSVEDIPKSWEEQWANLPTNPELHIPATNHFIPDNFDLLSSEKDVPEYPEKLCQDDWGELWFRQDLKFKLPRSYCYIFLLSELPLQSPRLAALLDLYLNLFQQQVMEDVYPANMAQYQYSISASERGIVIKMNGFNQKLSKLLDLLLHHMETFGDNLHEKAFQEIRQQQMKSYHNAILKPGIVRKDVRLSIIQQVHWTAHQKLAEVKNVTSKDLLEEFVARLFPSCHVQMLVQGNTTASQALDMYSMVKATKEKHLVIEKCPLPELRTLELQSGCWVARVNGVNSADTNSSVVNYYQYKEGSLMLEVILEFIQMVMDEPVFDVLRTREQLGYHVFCTNHNTFGILGLSITVNTQANKFSVSHVDERIEAFLEEFMTTVKNMKDDELSELQETLTSMKQTIDLTLREEVDRNWSEIVHAEYVFDRLKRQIELIKNITHESVINCVRKITSSDDNTGYKKLSVQVAGAAKPEGRSPPSLESLMGNTGIVQLLEPNGESDRKLPVERFITDIGNHKKQLRLYPVTKII